MIKRLKQAPQLEFPDTFRSFVVVALTVQVPEIIVAPSGERFMDEENRRRTVIQPGGRLGAQVGHVSDIVGTMLLKKYLQFELQRPDAYKKIKKTEIFWETKPAPITRIVKACRDSAELEHVYGLLQKANIPVWDFEDEQPDYGEGIKVRTAIATTPVDREEVIGLIDYLPLWDPDEK